MWLLHPPYMIWNLYTIAMTYILSMFTWDIVYILTAFALLVRCSSTVPRNVESLIQIWFLNCCWLYLLAFLFSFYVSCPCSTSCPAIKLCHCHQSPCLLFWYYFQCYTCDDWDRLECQNSKAFHWIDIKVKYGFISVCLKLPHKVTSFLLQVEEKIFIENIHLILLSNKTLAGVMSWPGCSHWVFTIMELWKCYRSCPSQAQPQTNRIPTILSSLLLLIPVLLEVSPHIFCVCVESCKCKSSFSLPTDALCSHCAL